MSTLKGEIQIKGQTGLIYGDLQRALGEISLDILNDATTALNGAKKDAAIWATGQLRAESVRRRWPHYAKGWDYTATGKKSKRYIVHNKTHYQLTHLLEKGHRIVTKDGRDTGKRAPAYPHIAEVNDKVPDIVEEQFYKRLKEQGTI